MPQPGDFYGYLFSSFVVLVTTALTIHVLSKKGHSHEIYLIWLIISFFFLLLSGMYLIAQNRGVSLAAVCGAYEQSCDSIYKYLTNTEDELRLVIAATTLCIGPQLLTYVLSGLSGSASPPKYVGKVTKVAVWSLVKFSAGLGGILLALPTVLLVTGKPVLLEDFFDGLHFIFIAFVYTGIYFAVVERIQPRLRAQFEQAQANDTFLRILLRLHRLFTRNTRKQSILDDRGETRQDSSLPKI